MAVAGPAAAAAGPRPVHAAALQRVRAASSFVARIVGDDDAMLRDWLGAAPRLPGVTAAQVSDAAARLDNDAAVMAALRRLRNREMARIAARALSEVAPLEETLGEVSDLADACCQAALDCVAARLRLRYGTPRTKSGEEARPIVLGMGKLGGRELNFSSDIDLIFAFTALGDTDGNGTPARSTDNADYFAQLAREAARLLTQVSSDGFVFRVDTQLRPFGSAGSAAISVPAMEHYYQAHGREWERYALIKARPIAGDRFAGQQLLEQLRPFVYRRYLDFNALGALRELKGLIDTEARKRGAEDDLKLGPGGIRELEFIVQLFQLMRGGHDARLRDARLQPVLSYLGASGLLPAAVAEALQADYVWLRRCENAVQMYADQQTHRLPQDEAARTALCAAMDVPDWLTLCAQRDAVRGRVQTEFRRLFAPRRAAAPRQAPAETPQTLWTREGAALVAWFEQQGYAGHGEPLARAFEDLRGSRVVRLLGDVARLRLQQVLAELIPLAAAEAEPATALRRSLRLLGSIAGRGTYVALLHESTAVLRRLVHLVGASPWITELLAQTPALLDALLDERIAHEAPERAELFSELGQRAAGVAAGDAEAVMDLLRRYRQEMTLRIAAADLSGALPLVRVSDRLTWLAEAIVTQALAYARAQLQSAIGAPPRDGATSGAAIIAYGKFGSIELGYGSDLDLVFVYDAADAEALTQGGVRSLSSSEYYLRLAQRVVQLLSAQTGAGRAYEVDLELRPSGNSGLVVTRLAGFARYQRDSAWIWEHQALLRARTVAGAPALCAAIEGIRREVLTRPRDAERLHDEVAAMRAKMRAALDKSADGRWDVKQGPGGLIDAEFLTQYLCLLHAAEHPALIEYPDNWRQLEALCSAGLLVPDDRDALLAAERAYRGWLHRRALQQQDAFTEDAAFSEERAAVQALWHRYLGD